MGNLHICRLSSLSGSSESLDRVTELRSRDQRWVLEKALANEAGGEVDCAGSVVAEDGNGELRVLLDDVD
jgi:hypothetical protein